MFDVRPAIAYLFDYSTDADVGGDKRFEGENAPRGTAISYYLKSAATGRSRCRSSNALGQVVCTSTGPSTAGIHRVQWTLVAPGTAPQHPVGGAGAGGGVVVVPEGRRISRAQVAVDAVETTSLRRRRGRTT